jgi:putative membrane protein
MKYIARLLLFQIIGLWFASQLIPTLVVVGNWQSLFIAGIILGLLMLIIRPILKILFIPINFITFGLLSWLVDVIILFILTMVMPQVQVREWLFPGVSVAGFVIPAIKFTYFLSLIASTLVISFISNVLEFVASD